MANAYDSSPDGALALCLDRQRTLDWSMRVMAIGAGHDLQHSESVAMAVLRTAGRRPRSCLSALPMADFYELAGIVPTKTVNRLVFATNIKRKFVGGWRQGFGNACPKSSQCSPTPVWTEAECSFASPYRS